MGSGERRRRTRCSRHRREAEVRPRRKGRIGALRSSSRLDGQSLVEFVLILPVLLLLILGVIEFGSLLASYIMVQSASREAARYAAAVGDTGPGTLNRYEDCAGIRAAALRVSGPLQAVSTIVIEYDNGPGSSTLVPGGCPPPGDQVGLGTRVIVQVRATHRPLVPLLPVGPIEMVSETARSILTDVVVEP